MYKQDLKINFGKLEEIASDLKSYRKSLNKVSKVNQRFIKELNKGKSEGFKALQKKYNQLQVEIEDCIEELKDLENIFTDYCEDMTAILPPINKNELMHVGKRDVKANLKSIDSAYRSAEVLKTMTSMQDSPGFWLSEEEKEEEKRKMCNNYQKMESIRTVDIVNLVNELNAQKTELWSLFHNKISAFEDMDDEYRTKANKLYKKYTNTVEYVKEKGRWLAWDLPAEFDKGVLSNLGNTIKGLLIDPYVKSVTVKAALFDWAKAEITGAEDSLGEQYIKNEIETGKMLLKDPFLIVEGIAQESSDTVEDKGIAYASGYVGMEVVKAVVLKKIASGEIALGEANAGVNFVDDVAEGTSSTVQRLTNSDIKSIIKKNGMSVDDFSELLNPNRVLTADEMSFVIKIRNEIGTPVEGAIMNKTIPQSDIYKYLYDKSYSGVRGFVSVDEHSGLLKGLNNIFEGNRLDYNGTAFKTDYGVNGISKSVGSPDTVYGKITYKLKNADAVKIPTDVVTEANAPFTGRGFTGSENIILPELVQGQRGFVKGDILSIYESKTGAIIQQLVFDKKLGWIEKIGGIYE